MVRVYQKRRSCIHKLHANRLALRAATGKATRAGTRKRASRHEARPEHAPRGQVRTERGRALRRSQWSLPAARGLRRGRWAMWTSGRSALGRPSNTGGYRAKPRPRRCVRQEPRPTDGGWRKGAGRAARHASMWLNLPSTSTASDGKGADGDFAPMACETGGGMARVMPACRSSYVCVCPRRRSPPRPP